MDATKKKELEADCYSKGWFAIGPMAMQKYAHSLSNPVDKIIKASLLTVSNGDSLTIPDNIIPGTIGVYVIRNYNLNVVPFLSESQLYRAFALVYLPTRMLRMQNAYFSKDNKVIVPYYNDFCGAILHELVI
jgi:hypothetical protein